MCNYWHNSVNSNVINIMYLVPNTFYIKMLDRFLLCTYYLMYILCYILCYIIYLALIKTKNLPFCINQKNYFITAKLLL